MYRVNAIYPDKMSVMNGGYSFRITEKTSEVRCYANPYHRRKRLFYTLSPDNASGRPNVTEVIRNVLHFSKKEIKKICRGVGGRFRKDVPEFRERDQAIAFADVLFITMVITQRISDGMTAAKMRGYILNITAKLVRMNPLLKITGESPDRDAHGMKMYVFYHRALHNEYPFSMSDRYIPY